MSTTVIASRHDARLVLLPAASPPLDREAVGRVLARHGLTIIDGSDLAGVNEFIAAEGLEPAAAVRLADDLKAIGLTVRVVNRTGLTTSQRIGGVLAGLMILGAMSSIGIGTGIIGLTEGDPIIGAMFLTVSALGMLLAAFNGVTLQRGSGSRLRVAGQTADRPAQLTEQLAGLAEHLPGHLVAPMLERARRLEAHARRDPDGQAAAELESLVAELRGHDDQAAADEAKQLREDVARARRAMQEARQK